MWFAGLGARIAARWALAGGTKGVAGGLLKALWSLLNKKVPLRVWMLAALLAWGWHWHNGKVAAAHQAGISETETKYAKKATRWVQRIDEIAAKRRSINSEANRRIDAHAGSLLVRGPGKAACAYPAAPIPHSGPNPPGRPGPAGVDRVPDEGRPALAAVPFNDFVAIGRFCALNRQEVIDRRGAEQETLEWWQKQVKP